MEEKIAILEDRAVRAIQANNLQLAIEIIDEILKLKNNLEFKLLKAGFQIELNQLTEAETTLNEVLKKDKLNKEALNNLAFIKMLQKDYKESLKYYETLIQLDEFDTVSIKNKGIILGHLNKTDKAIECFDKALEINKEDIPALINKGSLLAGINKHEEAIKCFDKVIEIDPYFDLGYLNKAIALYELKQFKKASQFINKAIDLNPTPHALMWKDKISN